MTRIHHEARKETQDFLIEFPFRIKSALAKFVVADNLHVQRMDDEVKVRLLRIKDAEYTESGKLTKFTQLPGCMFSGEIGPDIDEIDEFCSSNYMLIAPSPERAKEFNFALKLLGNSASALYIGFKTTTPAKYFLGTPCYFGRSPLAVEEVEASQLVKLVKLIEDARADKKLQTMREIYMHALTKKRRKESRFIELSIILEMLLLPTSSAELSYRFSLRLAKFMSKHTGQPVSDVFQLARRIYTTRSRLVHAGADNSIDDIAPTTFDYVRILLVAYLRDRESFQEDCLDQLCLG
jgi:Apea-like HEPN